MDKVKTEVKNIEFEGRPAVLAVTYGLKQPSSNQTPYFSLTGSLRFLDGKGGNRSGIIHSIILQYFPELEKFAKLHLSDVNGLPMHSVENGWYFLGKTEYSPYNRDALAKHFRISPEEADRLHDTIETKNDLANYVFGNSDRWKQEAKDAIAYLNV